MFFLLLNSKNNTLLPFFKVHKSTISKYLKSKKLFKSNIYLPKFSPFSLKNRKLKIPYKTNNLLYKKEK